MKTDIQVNCPYCGRQAILVNSSVIYHGRNYGFSWVCSGYPKCDAYVGCHKGTKQPLGTLANARLRELRKTAHSEFDQLWKSGKMSRRRAYMTLQEVMGLSKSEAHIGRFSEEQCNKIIEYLRGI